MTDVTSPAAAIGDQEVQGFNVMKLAVLAGIIAVMLAVPPFLSGYEQRIICSILLYIMLGSGLTIVVGYAGLLDLGFIAFYAVGAYTYAILASAHFDIHLPFALILVIGGVLAGIIGLLLGFPVLRLRGDYLAIVTLGFGEIIRVLVNNVDWLTNGPQGITLIDRPSLLGFTFTSPLHFLYLFAAFAALTVFLVHRLELSALGRSWRAIREDQDAAAGVGIDVTRAKLAAFMLSATIGGVAGVLFASFQRYVSPESFILQESILVLLIIIVGGLGNLLGVVLGSIVLIVMPEALRGYEELRMLLVGAMLVAIVLFRPRGLLPRSLGLSALIGYLKR
jgi:ABC-type branched-chain amino acid transport system, permease component